MTTARVSPGTFSELGPINWVLCRIAASVMKVPEVNLFATLGRQRGLFRAWLRYSSTMMPGGTLSRYQTELVILRVSSLRSCQYERDHHRRIGRKVGIDASVLARVDAGPTHADWNERDRALLSAVDQLVLDRDLADPVWATLAQNFSQPQLVELCMLVGQYEALATTIKALRIQRDV